MHYTAFMSSSLLLLKFLSEAAFFAVLNLLLPEFSSQTVITFFLQSSSPEIPLRNSSQCSSESSFPQIIFINRFSVLLSLLLLKFSSEAAFFAALNLFSTNILHKELLSQFHKSLERQLS